MNSEASVSHSPACWSVPSGEALVVWIRGRRLAHLHFLNAPQGLKRVGHGSRLRRSWQREDRSVTSASIPAPAEVVGPPAHNGV